MVELSKPGACDVMKEMRLNQIALVAPDFTAGFPIGSIADPRSACSELNVNYNDSR